MTPSSHRQQVAIPYELGGSWQNMTRLAVNGNYVFGEPEYLSETVRPIQHECHKRSAAFVLPSVNNGCRRQPTKGKSLRCRKHPATTTRCLRHRETTLTRHRRCQEKTWRRSRDQKERRGPKRQGSSANERTHVLGAISLTYL